MSEMLDGFLWCGECGMPMLSDGEGNYAHIDHLSVSRISELIMDPFIAGKLAYWFINLKGYCEECGEEKYPFAGITEDEFMEHVRTPEGAHDFAMAVKDLFAG